MRRLEPAGTFSALSAQGLPHPLRRETGVIVPLAEWIRRATEQLAKVLGPAVGRLLNPLELIAVAAVAFIVASIAHDGEANWFEGLLLVAVYLILALAFFFVGA